MKPQAHWLALLVCVGLVSPVTLRGQADYVFVSSVNGNRVYSLSAAEKQSLQSRVAFSPNGKTILTWGPDHMARFWNTDTGKEICSFLIPEMNCVAFSPDGTKIVVGEHGEFRGL